jgi:hypothetical protein
MVVSFTFKVIPTPSRRDSFIVEMLKPFSVITSSCYIENLEDVSRLV